MLKIIVTLLFFGVLIIGDIVWDGIETLCWNLRQKFPQWKLNYNKRRHPQRVRRYFR